MMDEPTGKSVILGNFEVTLAVSTSRNIKIAGYIFDGEGPDAINARIDGVMDVLDRQGIRADIVNKEAQIAGQEAHISQFEEQLAMLLTKKDAGEKLSHPERTALNTMPGNLEAIRRTVASLQHAIDAGKKKLNGTHA